MPEFRIIPPDTDNLWAGYLECRYRNLYQPFGLDRAVTTSELDSPRDRLGVLHRCVVVGESVVGVGRLDMQPGHPDGPSAQVRYFAVDPDRRGSGISQALLSHQESLAARHGAARVWMEARVAALNFYLRQGYTDIGPGPLKWGLIPHRVLHKPIASATAQK